MQNHRVLVTGGAGFIGSELVRQLAQHRFRVSVVENLLLVALRYRKRTLIDSVRRAFRVVHLSVLEEKFDTLLTSFADGLGAPSSAGQMLTLVLMTVAIWATEVGLIWGLATALGLAVSFKSAVVASAVLGLGLMTPPLRVVWAHTNCSELRRLKLAGIAAGSALALTVMIHARVFVANIVLGMCSSE